MDDPVAGPQDDGAAVAHELRERPLGLDVRRLGVGRRVAEGLQDEIGAEPEAGQVLEFGPVHGARGVLAPDGRTVGSQAVPGATPSTPHARPTIFWARV